MKIWAILGAHAGDNNQVLALAEALGLPFERKQLTYNHWRHLGPRILGSTLCSLTAQSRAEISGELPDVTISAGHRSAPVVQALRSHSKTEVRSIHVGYPRISPAKFDLVIATPEYPIDDHPNLLRIPFALTPERAVSDYDSEFWGRYPHPRRLLIVGGPTLYWHLSPARVFEALDRLLAAAHADGGSALVVGSPRTPRRLLLEIQTRIADAQSPAALVPLDGRPTYAALLKAADIICVTADSVAMVSDAIVTQKPVGLVPIEPSVAGRLLIGLMDRFRPGRRMHPRDLRFFWQEIEKDGFVGSTGQPKLGAVPDLNHIVADRVRPLLASFMNSGSG